MNAAGRGSAVQIKRVKRLGGVKKKREEHHTRMRRCAIIVKAICSAHTFSFVAGQCTSLAVRRFFVKERTLCSFGGREEQQQDDEHGQHAGAWGSSPPF